MKKQKGQVWHHLVAFCPATKPPSAMFAMVFHYGADPTTVINGIRDNADRDDYLVILDLDSSKVLASDDYARMVDEFSPDRVYGTRARRDRSK